MTSILIFLALSVVWWMWARPFIRKRWQQIEREAKMEEHPQLNERRKTIFALEIEANSLRRQHRHQEAIAVLDQIENEFRHETDPYIRRILSSASKARMLNLGLLHPDDGELPPGLDFDQCYLTGIIRRRDLTKSRQQKGYSVSLVPFAEEKKSSNPICARCSVWKSSILTKKPLPCWSTLKNKLASISTPSSGQKKARSRKK